MAAFLLAPLVFDADEVDLLLLALQVLGELGEPEVKSDVDTVLAKIAAALPNEIKDAPEKGAAGVAPLGRVAAERVEAVQMAIGRELRLRIRYADKKGNPTDRIVWPIILRDDVMLTAWCETRGDFRNFRLDRMAAATPVEGQRYPTRRRILFALWRAREMTSEVETW